MDLAIRSLEGPPLSAEELLGVLGPELPLLPLLHEAYRVRQHSFGNRVHVHILNNARNARCPEDCRYCSQSAVSRAPVQPYDWKSSSELLAGAHEAWKSGAYRYCIVASGRGPRVEQVEELAAAVRRIKSEVPLKICVSVGLLDEPAARVLKAAGVDRLNHNLNTSERHYPEICSTHTYADRIATLKAARGAGLELCSGVIAGMGEEPGDLVEVALTLRRLAVPSIPVNFLIPIGGNPLQSDGSLTPERCLRVLAMFRLANPAAEIRAAGGRERNLGALEALALYPANSLFVEGYLTTRGKAALETYRMIRDAGFVVQRADGEVASWGELGLEEGPTPPTDDILKPELLSVARASRALPRSRSV